jgi:hypothetical protein
MRRVIRAIGLVVFSIPAGVSIERVYWNHRIWPKANP